MVDKTNKLTLNAHFDKDRNIISWFFCGFDKLLDLEPIFIESLLNIHDIFLSPRSAFFVFPIETAPKYGKVYKDLYLIHPSAMTDPLLPICAVNTQLLNIAPVEDVNFFRDPTEYLAMFDNPEVLEHLYHSENFHLIGVHNPIFKEKVKLL